MKIIFNDASELQVQSVSEADGCLQIKTISAAHKELREKFSDAFATKAMEVQERGRILAAYKDYTVLYRLEEYTGGIHGVVMYKEQTTPEAQAEVLNAAVMVAQIQAQALPDEQAITVQSIYPVWDGNGASYAAGFKVLHNGTLYKCLQAHTSQSDWVPDVAVSLWAKVLIPDANIIPEWEQPGSTNPYMQGDKVTHNGKTWQSNIDNNVWEPGVYGWSVVE